MPLPQRLLGVVNLMPPPSNCGAVALRAAVDALPPSGADLVALNARFEGAPSEEILAWAFGEFGPALSVVSSFQNCVLIDLATQVDCRAEIIFLDTGAHFAETLNFVDHVHQLYGLNLRIIRPGIDAEPWPCGSERCCEMRKVVPLARALMGRRAWVSGLKRSDTSNRAASAIVGWDSARGLVKINPLACWTNADVSRYEADASASDPPLEGAGVPVHRVRTHDPTGLSFRRSASWPLAGNG